METKKPPQPLTRKFEVGQCAATPGALEAITENAQYPIQFIARHQAGDWGDDLSENDRAANELALLDGSRILSAYHLRDQTRIWVITEADRTRTTILLPDEY